MSTAWQALLANVAIVIIMVSAWAYLQQWFVGWVPKLRNGVYGLCAGFGTIAIMQLPFVPVNGVYLDLRSTLIALTGFFVGPGGGILAGTIAAIYRIFEGGVGVWAGCCSIALAVLIGIGYRYVSAKSKTTTTDILNLSLAVSASVVISFFALPIEIWKKALPEVVIPVVTAAFISTFLSGMAILQENRRRETARSNRIFRSIIDSLPDCLNVKDVEGKFLAANPATAKLMSAGTVDELLGATDFDFYPRETALEFRADELRMIKTGIPATLEQRFVHLDKSITWLSTLKAPLRDRGGAIIGVITHNRDITLQKALEDQLAEIRIRLEYALAHMMNGLVMFNNEGVLIFSNQQYIDMFPLTAEFRRPGANLKEILRSSCERGEVIGVGPGTYETWITDTYRSLTSTGRREIPLADGRWLDARSNAVSGGASLIVYSDISATKEKERELVVLNTQLEALAKTDGLTMLMNRRTFDLTFLQEFARHSRSRCDLSILLLDVDNFKAFNDTYGHPAGDDCLRQVSLCLTGALMRPTDIAARYGGEEFVAILPETDEAGAIRVAERVCDRVRNLKIRHDGSDKKIVTVSIGSATVRFDDLAMRSQDLLRYADEALYAAKAAGRDRSRNWQSKVATNTSFP